MAQRKRSRRHPAVEPPATGRAASVVPAPGAPGAPWLARGLWVVAAAVAVVGWFAAVRARAPEPWDYDEFYHVGLARVLRAEGMPESFRWTPFSIAYEHFADKEALFHYALVPFSGLPLRQASFAGALLGQLLVVGVFAWLLWRLRVPRAPLYVLALAGMGTLFLERMVMCRPHHGEIAFTLLFLGLLLVEAHPLALAGVAAVFGLSHASGWLPIALAALWVVAFRPGAGEPWRPRWLALVATAAGWLAGQLVHPAFPHNFALLWAQNVTVLRESAGGDAALQSQIGSELLPLYGPLVPEQWPALAAAALLVLQVARRPHFRRREVLVIGGLAIAFLVAAIFVWMRFFELAVPLTLLALGLGAAAAPPARRPARRWPVVVAVLAIAIAAAWSHARVRERPIGRVSPPAGMAAWLAEHGRSGERVFTAIWADSAPLFYAAPQLQSLVALDPTFFWIADPELFRLYVRVVEGREPRPARAIRERFGARWVTLWKVPSVRAFARQLAASGEARVVYSDDFYLVFDLGAPPAGAAAPGR